MQALLTLVAAPGSRALLFEAAVRAGDGLALADLVHGEPARAWLENGEALDVTLTVHAHGGLADWRRAALGVLGAELARYPIDWALQTDEPRRKRVLIADMDSTIIGCECLDELADFAGKKAEIAAITERAMAGELVFENALRERVAMLAGLELAALQACYDQRVRLNPGARTLVTTMAAHGARCALVSGGFTFFTARVAAAAGFQTERANRLLDDGAALTGAVAEPILGRAAKRAALEEECSGFGLSPAAAMAIGDGANDLAMIEIAGLGVAYHARPIVAAEANARIVHTSLEAALFFQGYQRADFARDP
jgi:phosphoserine phosphatase